MVDTTGWVPRNKTHPYFEKRNYSLITKKQATKRLIDQFLPAVLGSDAIDAAQIATRSFSDAGGTAQSVPGGVVAALRDTRGALVAGSEGAARPLLGRHPARGIANRLPVNMAANATGWAIVNAVGGAGVLATIDDADAIASLGLPAGVRAYRVDNSAGTGDARLAAAQTFSSLSDFSMSAFIRSISGPLTGYALRTGFGGYPVLPSITTSYVRYSRNRSERNAGANNANDTLWIVVPAGAIALIVVPQVEAGLSVTAPQATREAGLDITEAGQRSLWYLRDDGVDDAMTATLPDMGANATVAYASDLGVTVLTGQTIAAGAFDILRDTRLYGMVIVPRALSATETARLDRYLKGLAGIE